MRSMCTWPGCASAIQVRTQADECRHTRLEKLRSRPFDGQALKRLVEAGLTWLKTNQQTVNSLNVFPVPDGDTGTNMMLTMTSAWNEIKDFGREACSARWRRWWPRAL